MIFISFAISSIHKNCFHFILCILNYNNNNNDNDNDYNDNDNDDDDDYDDNENNCTKILWAV